MFVNFRGSSFLVDGIFLFCSVLECHLDLIVSSVSTATHEVTQNPNNILESCHVYLTLLCIRRFANFVKNSFIAFCHINFLQNNYIR